MADNNADLVKSDQGLQGIQAGRCQYLGLKDDPMTCMAYPSIWNYCHHVRPSQSLREEYQGQYCQTPEHTQCPFYEFERIGPLPREMRGEPLGGMLRSRRVIRILLLIFIVAALISWPFVFPDSFSNAKRDLQALIVEKSISIKTTSNKSTPSPSEQFVGVLPLVPSTVPTAIGTAPGMNNLNPTPTPVLLPPQPSPAGVCGYSLDVAFGSPHRFILHQVKPGESLNKYAATYQTSENAIQSLNYQLPIPVRSGWVLVIPFGWTQVDSLPSFVPYLATPNDGAIGKLADRFAVDPAQLEQYNGFDNSCSKFSGWVLIPHQKTP